MKIRHLSSATKRAKQKFDINIGLHPKQAEVFLDSARFRVVVAGRRWGKTNLSKIEILARAKLPKRKIWYIAPTYRMAKQIMWNDLKESIPRDWIVRIHETEMSVTLMNGTVIECKGADNPDTLRGVGLHFVVLDEYQDIRSETWTAIIRPTLAKDRGEALFIGTPKAYNQLYEVYQLGQDPARTAWSSYQFPTITSPFIPEEEIADARRDMDPRTFRQEFEACHLPDTEVLLFNGGTKKICEVKPGDELCHITSSGELVPCEVEAVGETGQKVITDVILETGEVITASAHHNFKVHYDRAA